MLQKIKRRSKRDYFIKKCTEFKSDTKRLWKTINNAICLNNDKSCIIDCIKVGKNNITNPGKIASELGHHFSTIGQKVALKGGNSNKQIVHYLNKIKTNQSSVYLAPCTPSKLSKIIDLLPNKTSSGYDDINNILLKKLKDSLLLPLSMIFNLSISSGIFPDDMKLAEIIPLLKSGSRCILTNYRPISLLPTISKLLEKIIYSQTYDFLIKNNILFNSQYGFRKKHSCEHAVTELLGKITKGLEKNKHTIAVFIDLSKAFDTISHDILFEKMERYGIRGTALNWYKSYLQNRTMHVKCNTSTSSNTVYSDLYDLDIGTPQESCLGPLIFLIFCNDLYLNLELYKGILFADDTTLYNSHENLDFLQWSITHDLSILSDWFKANQLSMNEKKSVCMLFSNKNCKLNSLAWDDQKIFFVDSTKFLGIWIDHRLTWRNHLEKIYQKVKRNQNLLKLSKYFLNLHAKRLIYFAQIQSHLTYGLSIWGNMSSSTALYKLQKLQNNCLALITGRKASTKLYQTLKILRVNELLELENCKFGYKVINNSLPIRIMELTKTDHKGATLIKQHHYSTRQKNCLNKALAKNTKYKKTIIYKGTSTFETLGVETRNKSSLQSFVIACKNELFKHYE